MASSFHHIDLASVLSRYHSQVEQQQERPLLQKGSHDGSSPRDKCDDDDISTISSFSKTAGWDETIVDNHEVALTSWQLWQARGVFLTPHAMAVQSWLYGTTDNPYSKGEAKLSIRWKTSLAPHRIHQWCGQHSTGN
jgi:hypothetical protein